MASRSTVRSDFDSGAEVRSYPDGKNPAMIAEISPESYNQFFAWAPLLLGIIIYAVFYVAKRRETSPSSGTPFGQSYACAGCGRRGHREHMVPREHAGAVSWYCSRCAGSH